VITGVRVADKQLEVNGFLPSDAPKADRGGGVLGEGANPAASFIPISKGLGGARCISSPIGVRGGAPGDQRFSCTFRSPGSLFCYVIKSKQLQKSLSLAANGMRQPHGGPETLA